MPPKAAEKGMSKKTENKQKAKVVEDLTFGLKNKNKSAKVQAYVKQVSHQVMHGSQGKVSFLPLVNGVFQGASKMQEAEYQKKEEKEKSAAQKALLASLFKSVTEVKLAEDGESK